MAAQASETGDFLNILVMFLGSFSYKKFYKKNV